MLTRLFLASVYNNTNKLMTAIANSFLRCTVIVYEWIMQRAVVHVVRAGYTCVLTPFEDDCLFSMTTNGYS